MSDARRSRKVAKQLPFSFVEEELEPVEVEEEYPQEEIKVVSVVLARHKIVNVTGKVTGRKYTFRGAGSIVDDVDIRDAELMVSAPLIKSCCGSVSTAQFQILGR